MPSGSDLSSLEYIKDADVMVGSIKCSNVDRQEADIIYEYYLAEVTNHPDYSDFVLDARTVENVSNSAIGILMKSLEIMKRGKTFAILVMTEKLLQEIMLQHPEMFDFYAVFHTLDDALSYVKKRK